MTEQLNTIDDYFAAYGKAHVAKATKLMDPLHQPGVDPPPDTSELLRQPYEAQAHVIGAAIRMLDSVGKGIIVGECGTGKTIIGASLIHLHANRSFRKGGCRGKYRALILCPDHLLPKWVDEIESTVPNAKVFSFDAEGKGHKNLIVEMIRLRDQMRGPKGGKHRWRIPDGPEFFVLGRNQAKYLPERANLGSLKEWGFNGEPFDHGSSRRGRLMTKMVDGVENKYRNRAYHCPKCDARIADKNGAPLDIPNEKGLFVCEARYAVEIPMPNKVDTGKDILGPYLPDGHQPGKDRKRHTLLPSHSKLRAGHVFEQDGKYWQIRVCGEPLWQFTSTRKRWPPGEFLSTQMKGAFQYMIFDELHEGKSGTAARAVAAGKLIQSIPYVVGMTGTLIGGYASHLFPFLYRLSPQRLVELGFDWSKVMPFVEEYGRIERTVKTTTDAKGNTKVNRTSMRLDGEDTSNSVKAAPGIMPALFSHLLIDKAIFLSLSEMSDNLPRITEYVSGLSKASLEEEQDKHFWVDCRVRMNPEQETEYKRVESELVAACHDLLIKGSMKLLGAMLHTLLGYQDRPWDWDYPDEIRAEYKRHLAENPGLQAKHTVGHWGEAKTKTISNWTGIVTPANLPQEVIYPKERTLIDICLRENLAGNQTWVFVQMTDKRDVQERLKGLLEAHGLRVNVLRSKSVQTRDRLKWIDKMGPKSDVIISHPQPVETGIDFFSKKPGGHNFNAICFYQTGYSLLTMRQAAARGWRLGQPKDCRVYYLMYGGTMQEGAVKLMAKKMMAAKELDGDLSVEGLASMVDSSSEAMALARSISNSIDDVDIARHWNKIGGTRKTGPISGIDLLPTPVALAVHAISKPEYKLDLSGIDLDKLSRLFREAARGNRAIEF